MEIEKSRKRAIRRHHIARLKKKRKNYWGYPTVWQWGVWEPNRFSRAPQPMDARQLGKVVQYPAVCSCEGCCNVRRAPHMNGGTGLTYREMCHWQNYREGLEEVENKNEESQAAE
jgi:hypothetical protein